jgi:predicted ester cyclase
VTIDTLTARELLERFARSHDTQCLAEAAVLEVVATAQLLSGRPSIATFLRGLSYESFADARLAVRTVAIDERTGIGVVEWSFSGRHVATAFGIAPSGRMLTLSLSAVCELGPEGITRTRLYFDTATVHAQLETGEGDKTWN